MNFFLTVIRGADIELYLNSDCKHVLLKTSYRTIEKIYYVYEICNLSQAQMQLLI